MGGPSTGTRGLDRPLEQVPVGRGPTDPLGHFIKDAGLLPRGLWLSSLGGESPGTLPHVLLLGNDFVNETSGRREPVRLGESLRSPPSVRRCGIVQRLDADAIVAKRRHVLKGVGDVVDGPGRPGIVPIQDAHRLGAPSHQVPPPEVTVTYELAGVAGVSTGGPPRLGGRMEAADSLVVVAQETCHRDKAGVLDDLGPRGTAGLAVNVGEDLTAVRIDTE